MHKKVLSKRLQEGATWVGDNIRMGLNRYVLRHGLETSGSRWGQVLASCEHCSDCLLHCHLGNVVK